jgi:hypothetical protein
VECAKFTEKGLKSANRRICFPFHVSAVLRAWDGVLSVGTAIARVLFGDTSKKNLTPRFLSASADRMDL